MSFDRSSRTSSRPYRQNEPVPARPRTAPSDTYAATRLPAVSELFEPLVITPFIRSTHSLMLFPPHNLPKPVVGRFPPAGRQLAMTSPKGVGSPTIPP